ncbi:MAG: tRNA (guanine37-N1)-methyltransferase [Sphingobacteriales bacterium]|jgi:tRNA (guanine37-N1)-methyltransferase
MAKLRIDIVTPLPGLLESHFGDSILKRAQDKNIVSIHLHNLREFSTCKHSKIDDYQYGGGAGMVMTPQPLADCLDLLLAQRTYDEIIYMTPDGVPLDQSICNQYSSYTNLLMVCGHYKGIDQRIRDKYITSEISIGDYVLTSGELAATVLSDSIIRLVPGVLGNETSALSDSFQDDLLAPPVYTRPEDFRGLIVPKILLSGHDAKVEQWRFDQSMERTKNRRPDLFEKWLKKNS